MICYNKNGAIKTIYKLGVMTVMKRMISCICITSILMLSLTSCIYMHNGAPAFKKKWSKLRDQVVDVVMYSARDGEGDKAKVYEILKNALSEEDFEAEYQRLHTLFKDLSGNYSVTVESFSSEEENNVTVQKGKFGFYTSVGNFIAEASLRSDTNGLSSFSIVPDTEGILPPKK